MGGIYAEQCHKAEGTSRIYEKVRKTDDVSHAEVP